MRKAASIAVVFALILGLGSCAGTVYTRRWSVNNADLTDTLTISGDTFVLERLGSGGTSSFEGTFQDNGNQWVFDIQVWRPANAAAKRFDPPIRYLYKVKKFQDGVSFLELSDVIGTSNFQFIQAGDYRLR
jgi:hypothetical protein